MHVPWHRFFLIALCLLFSIGVMVPGSAAPSRQPLTITAVAIDPSLFHIVAYPSAYPTPPASPFVVKTIPWPGANTTHDKSGASRISTPDASLLREAATASFQLDSASGKPLLFSVSIAPSGDAVSVTMAHASGQRLYGAGNADMNEAGDLTHPSGTQIVSNGVTRVPFVWCTGGWGVLVANDQSGIAWHDDGSTLTWTVPSAHLDLYLIAGASGYAILDAYSRLTGRAPIPPRWTFGYMQSRWGYSDAADVQDKWHQFRNRQIPVDAFIYDYDWFNNDWEFNTDTFPPGSLAQMHRMGLRFVGIVKPRVNKANRDYARRQQWAMSSPQGTDLRFDLPEARYWWWSHRAPLLAAGVDGWWNDEAEQTYDEFFRLAQTEYVGGRAFRAQRVWTINRAFAPGMQRFGAAAWTGDIDSSWDALSNQPGTMLNWSLAGMPYVAQDIGGFQSTPSPELYARWVEEGVFVPVMRAHGGYNSPRWPWAFGSDVLDAAKKAIELRYRLIPYIYSYAAQTAAAGVPLMRPLFLEFPNDPKTFNLEDEWLLGDRLLAAPILSEGGARDIYLPAGRWYDFNSNAVIAGPATVHVQVPLNTIPAFLRAGSIVVLGPIQQSTALGVEDPLDVRVIPGADASFTLYEDDGISYAYEHGACSRIPITWNDRKRLCTIGWRTGTFAGMIRARHIKIVLPNGSCKSIVYNGRLIRVRL